MDSKTVEEIRNALVRRAVGYDTEETVEEYSGSGDDFTMVRRRVTKKNVPPDISAAKILLEEVSGDDYSSMTDEQLEAEKARLLAMLKETSVSLSESGAGKKADSVPAEPRKKPVRRKSGNEDSKKRI